MNTDHQAAMAAIFPSIWALTGFNRGSQGASRHVVTLAAKHLACYLALPSHLRDEVARTAQLLGMAEATALTQAAGTARLQQRADALGLSGWGLTAWPAATAPAPESVPQGSVVWSCADFGMCATCNCTAQGRATGGQA